MRRTLEMLGVAPGARFHIRSCGDALYWIDAEREALMREDQGGHVGDAGSHVLMRLYDDPHLILRCVDMTRDEYNLLDTLHRHSDMRFIARDSTGRLVLFDREPLKGIAAWMPRVGGRLTHLDTDLFSWVTWGDDKATRIEAVMRTQGGG